MALFGRAFSYFSMAKDLYHIVCTRPVPLNTLASSFFRRHKKAGAGDRRTVLSLVYGTLRYHYRLSAYFCSTDPALLITGYMKLFDPVFMEKIFKSDPTVLRSVFSDALATSIEALTLGSLADIPECPAFLRNASTHASFNAFTTKAPVGILVNTRRTSALAVLHALESVGIPATVHGTFILSVPFGTDLLSLPLYTEGLIAIADPASPLAMEATLGLSLSTILDYCAGSGGKSLALALMHPEALITAFDIDAHRIAPLAERFAHFGLPPIATHTPLNAFDTKVFDCVLVDAPCTATGTWRRHPELKLHLTQERLDYFLALQRHILEKTAAFVADGGYVLYCTCSILDLENTLQMTSFLEKHPYFSLVSEGHYDPVATASDGFYHCLLKRTGTALV